MRKLQWGRLFALIAIAAVISGLGYLIQYPLPEYMPFLQSDSWQWVGIILYHLGLILVFLFLIVFIIILITSSKSGPKKKVIAKEDDAIYRKKAIDFAESLGGIENITAIDSCMSRLKINVIDTDEIDQNKVQNLGASGIFLSGNQVQAIFGEESELLKHQIELIFQEKR